jgi:hypothetical protein
MSDPDLEKTQADIAQTGEALSLASERVKTLIDALGIKLVISVDDQYALPNAMELTQLIDTVLANSEVLDQVVILLSGADIDFSSINPDDAFELTEYLREIWQDLPAEVRLATLQTVDAKSESTGQALSAPEQQAEISGPSTLIELIGDSADFHRLSRQNWIAQSKDLIARGEPTLVFFDRDFSGEGAATDAGERLLMDLVGQHRDHVRCGLLTRAVANEDAELDHTRKLVKSSKAKPSDVVVIGKYRLENSADTFPEALRLLLLADEIEKLRALTIASIKSSAAAALKLVRDLQRYGLIATIASANKEGTFEPDGAMRIAQSAFRRQLIEDHRDPGFALKTLPALRDAGAVDVYLDSAGTGRQLAEILWNDQFETAEFLAKLGLPIEIGDIFELAPIAQLGTDPIVAKNYILLAQACDLSVRSNGRRSGFVTEFVLHEFRPMPLTADGKVNETRGRMQKVGAFQRDSKHVWGVDFASKITVPDVAVDGTVGTTDGRSTISATEASHPSMSQGWTLRRKKLQAEAAAMVKTQKKLEDGIPGRDSAAKREALARLGASVARGTIVPKHGVTAVIDTAGGSVRYGIRRVGRVAGATAVALVSMSATHEGRPAFEAEVVAV